MTPYEKWSNDKTDLEYLRVFGCRAFVHIPKEKCTKWDAKAKELMFIGYCEYRKGYGLINPVSNEITNTRDLQFLENQMYHQTNNSKTEFYSESLFSESKASYSDNEDNDDSNIETVRLVIDNSEIDSSENTYDTNNDASDNDINLGNSKPVLSGPHRETRIQNRFYRYNQDFDMNGMPDLPMPNLNHVCYVKAMAAMQNGCCFEPTTIDEALNGVDRNHWKGSISETILGHIKNKTWKIVDKPENKNIVDCKWVFKIKHKF